MKFNKLAISIGLTIGSVLFVSNSAQAAGFKTNFTQNNGPKGDVLLESIEQNGETIDRFSFVERVGLLNNDEYTGGNSGAASTDRGDNASAPGISSEDPTEVQLAKYLGNNNLNNIVDTEDSGTFMMDVFFDSLIREDNSGLDSLFFFERGMNSNLLIQALDEDGNTAGNQLFLKGKNKGISNSLKDKIKGIDRKEDQEYAGYQINTLEIGGNQNVGSWGVSLADLGVDSLSGVQIYASGRSYQGPDFKVIARKNSKSSFAQAARVPEPGTIIGLGSVAALAFVRRRKSK